MTTIGVAAVIVVLVVLLSVQTRSAFALLALFLPLVMWLRSDLFSFSSEAPVTHVGIAPSVPGLAAWGIVLLAGLVIVLVKRSLPPFTLVWAVPAGVLLLGYAAWWPQNELTTSGTLHWLLALLAWIVGSYCGRNIDINGLLGLRLAQLFAVIFGVELAVSLLQLVTGGGDLGRMTGMYGHPGFLGKAVVICLVVMLPLSVARRQVTRRWAIAAIAMSLAATGLTLSRTNIIAALLVVVVWSLFLPGTRALGAKLAMPLLAILMILPIAQLLLVRFEEDPEGGSRPELLAAGMRVLEQNFLTGVGANSFVDHASATESIVSSLGYPVHNTFILAAAELGVVGAIALALPLLAAFVTAFVRLRDKNPTRSAFARAVIIVTGGIIFIGSVSWGVLQTPNLGLIYFLFGFAFAQLTTVPPRDERDGAVVLRSQSRVWARADAR